MSISLEQLVRCLACVWMNWASRHAVWAYDSFSDTEFSYIINISSKFYNNRNVAGIMLINSIV